VQRFEKDIYRRGIPLRREILVTSLGVLITTVAAGLLYREIAMLIGDVKQVNASWPVLEQLLFGAVVAGLIYGNVAYQLTRLGYLLRLRSHRPASRDALDALYRGTSPRVTILVPSYKEEARIIRQSLWSAALQAYPDKRVVLLIDDPPQTSNPTDQAALERARRIPHRIEASLRPIGLKIEQAYERFGNRNGEFDPASETRRLAALHRDVAAWYEGQAATQPVSDHTDRLFVEKTFLEPARAHARRSEELASGSLRDPASCRIVYRRLLALFRVELSSFERKRYANLSHEPNKAMNLNSYLSLLGRRFEEVERQGTIWLEPAENGAGEIPVPDADYVITLDADSLLTWDYAERLVHFMQQPGNERVGVAQTPYTAVPDASGLLERVAGATTDMQYIVHQGFERHQATFWVGANALLRVSALRDIAHTREESGVEVTCYISDRTVIEDTESSVDLLTRGWKLYNYPERLSYSATPGDFGALLVQRRRWANGGLVILPKLLAHYARRSGRIRKLPEMFLRVHYLVSISLANIAVPLLLFLPFEDNLRSPWLPLAALPFFYLYGRDLVQAGYRWIDLPRVYALNLMLIPINLAGVAKSIQQGLTGKRIPFGRTPKIQGLTVAPGGYFLAEYAIIAYCLVGGMVDLSEKRWLHGVFALVNALFFLYATFRFVHTSPASRFRFWGRLQRATGRKPAHATLQVMRPTTESRETGS